jgi:hypothetical protein
MMFYRGSFLPLLVAFFIASVPSYGFAEIGKIGSPVVPSNSPKVSAKKDSSAKVAQKKEEEDNDIQNEDLAVIDFSRYHNNFTRKLRTAVEAKESTQVGVSYQVISTVPVRSGARTQMERVGQRYDANTNRVVRQLEDMGIPPERIIVRTEQNEDVSAQKIRIGVQQ